MQSPIGLNLISLHFLSRRGKTSLGALDGGPQCRLSILRNGNVPCHYFLDFSVDFKIV